MTCHSASLSKAWVTSNHDDHDFCICQYLEFCLQNKFAKQLSFAAVTASVITQQTLDARYKEGCKKTNDGRNKWLRYKTFLSEDKEKKRLSLFCHEQSSSILDVR